MSKEGEKQQEKLHETSGKNKGEEGSVAEDVLLRKKEGRTLKVANEATRAGSKEGELGETFGGKVVIQGPIILKRNS